MAEAVVVPTVSIVIPTYNERGNIEQVLRAAADALKNESYEVIVVDDDSPDRTWEIVEQTAKEVPGIRLLRRTGGIRDQAHSLMDGFKISRGGILGKMDADGSHPASALPELLRTIEAGCDVAVGSRYASGGTIAGWPLGRRILSRASTTAVRLLLGLKIHDPLSGFWLIRRELYERALRDTIPKGYKILLELCVRGHPNRIGEVPIHFQNRSRGKSKLRPALLFHAIALTTSLVKANLLDSLGAKSPDARR